MTPLRWAPLDRCAIWTPDGPRYGTVLRVDAGVATVKVDTCSLAVTLPTSSLDLLPFAHRDGGPEAA